MPPDDHVCQTAFSLHNDGPEFIDFVHQGIGNSSYSREVNVISELIVKHLFLFRP